MELTFLGRGAGFFPAEGSTSSYFLDNGELFLIDPGESIFKTILDKKVLDPVTGGLNILITHTHSDHIGSLGSLVLYASVTKKFRTNIITDENMAFSQDINTVLRIYGIQERMYQFTGSSAFDKRYSKFNKVRYIKTFHCEELKTCAILFETNDGLVFYSGDMKDPAPLVEILKSGKKIDKIYIDSYNAPMPNPYHFRLQEIHDIIPPELRPRVYCMHFNSTQCMSDAKAFGFNVVNPI
jgi:ribonuclease BN (tRNA processing enzyme)